MIENIDITIYSVLAIFLYLILVIVSVYNINPVFRNFVDTFAGKFRKIEFFRSILKFLSEKILPLFRFSASFAVKLLQDVSGLTVKIDGFLNRSNLSVFAEPVNLSALVIRKLYCENEQLLLAAAAGLIVVFYFILTVF